MPNPERRSTVETNGRKAESGFLDLEFGRDNDEKKEER